MEDRGDSMKYDVRIKPAGGEPFIWTNVEADHPYRATAVAFAEDYWPEQWEYIGPDLPERFYVTVTEVPACEIGEPGR